MYLSHEIGVRKPNIEAFQFILKQQKLNPNEVLFIDDSPQHIEDAKKLGINTYHLNMVRMLLLYFLAKLNQYPISILGV